MENKTINKTLYSEMLNLIENPNKERYTEYEKNLEESLKMVYNYIDEFLKQTPDIRIWDCPRGGSDKYNWGPIVRHLLPSKLKDCDYNSLDELVRESLRDKKVLEIGAGRSPNLLLRKHAGEYVVAELKNDKREKFYQEHKIESVLFDKESQDPKEYEQFHQKLEQAGPFDIIYTDRTFFDGDCGSMNFKGYGYIPTGVYEKNCKMVLDYFKHLKNKGMADYGSLQDDILKEASIKKIRASQGIGIKILDEN